MRCTDSRRTKAYEQQESGADTRRPMNTSLEPNGGTQTPRGVRTVGGRGRIGTWRCAHTRRTEMRGHQEACGHYEAYRH